MGRSSHLGSQYHLAEQLLTNLALLQYFLFQYDLKFIPHEFNNIARNDFHAFSGLNQPIHHLKHPLI